ncbi:hypothetical protein [Bifidobacterium sp. SO1]|uniref:hypothetical protein n=1 Tax=Bifidobacterium sp. SO1 TaxID=2809029 RepID=UPI001BDD0FE0|nr:hypothetical protein [Bifidobacterium sp. SO1]MBT1161679.1 hypothetical protein [Bifidobacterium sp. SO1]
MGSEILDRVGPPGVADDAMMVYYSTWADAIPSPWNPFIRLPAPCAGLAIIMFGIMLHPGTGGDDTRQRKVFTLISGMVGAAPPAGCATCSYGSPNRPER